MLKSRALGFWETFKAITHDGCHGFETICITTQLTGAMNTPLFMKALEFTYHRHPLLQATIQKKDSVYYYVFNNSFVDIPVQFTEGVSEALLQQSFHVATNCSLEPQKYLWKVDVFYEQNSALFTITIHHSPCDGRSMMTMVDDILYAYSCYLDDEIPNRPALPLLPPTEHLSPQSPSIESYLKHREQLIAATVDKNSMLSLAPQRNFVPMEQRSTHTLYKELCEEQTLKILDFCNKNDISNNSLLNGLMLNTAQQIYGDPLSLALLTPVHTKPPIEKDQVGCHVSLITTFYEHLSPTANLLELAHDYQRKLKLEIPKQIHLPKEFSELDVCNAFGLNLELDLYKYMLVVSNLGESPVSKKYKNNTVEKIQVGVNNRVGAVACVLITYIVHNKMQLGFVYTKPLISQDYMERFSDKFMQTMNELY